MRILLDTNIIVAGLMSAKGPPGQLISSWLSGRYELVTSEEQLEELARVLTYDRIRSRIDHNQAQNFIENVGAIAFMATDLPTITASPDPADNQILATAVAGKANLIVSGDKNDVLALSEIVGIPIVTAREALGWVD